MLLRVLVLVGLIAGAYLIFRKLIVPAFPSREGVGEAQRGVSEAEARLTKAELEAKRIAILKSTLNVGGTSSDES